MKHITAIEVLYNLRNKQKDYLISRETPCISLIYILELAQDQGIELSKPQLNVTSTKVGFDTILTLHNDSAPAQPPRQELEFVSYIIMVSMNGARMG